MVIFNLIIRSVFAYIYGYGSQMFEDINYYFNLGFAWPSLAIVVKRWHDRNKSGFWSLIYAIPVVGLVWGFVENGFLPGTKGENKYGPALNRSANGDGVALAMLKKQMRWEDNLICKIIIVVL